MIDKQRWAQLPWAQQLGHVGSELSRARHWEMKGDLMSREKALIRAFELLDLTLDDKRWRSRLKELARLREAVSDWFCGEKNYNIPSKALEDYCTRFVLGTLENNLVRK